ncbi:hypothetical protein [Chenggangzhangella methanolivorans]|uniref:Uncharacterized protein n=1 Tax=Chenggangzhangella methanolivorans TaxID=1437009 RepID=A0A9E6UGG7_9HYPH|nr:hypothetical protein [Chenggangzhangella methanolivorans]QZN98712.1 hypothetical protein K6K41_17145 [Chenggangzhangella methanolivorans]
MTETRRIATAGLLALIWAGFALFHADQASRLTKPFDSGRLVTVETVVAEVSSETVSTGTPSRPSRGLSQTLMLPDYPDVVFPLDAAIDATGLAGAQARLTMVGDPAAAQRDRRPMDRPVIEVVGVELGDRRLLDHADTLGRYEAAAARHDRQVGLFGVAAVGSALTAAWLARRRIATALRRLR